MFLLLLLNLPAGDQGTLKACWLLIEPEAQLLLHMKHLRMLLSEAQDLIAQTSLNRSPAR